MATKQKTPVSPEHSMMSAVDKAVANLALKSIENGNLDRITIKKGDLKSALGYTEDDSEPLSSKELVPMIAARLSRVIGEKYDGKYVPYRGWVISGRTNRAKAALAKWSVETLKTA